MRPLQGLKRQIAPPGKPNFGDVLEHRFVNGNPHNSGGCKPHVGGKALSNVHRDQHDIRGIISHSYVYVLVYHTPLPFCYTAFMPWGHSLHILIIARGSGLSVRRAGDPTVPAYRRTSTVHAAENPCRWGVDVFNYQLPDPRKLRGTATEENLGVCFGIDQQCPSELQLDSSQCCQH